MISTFMPHIPIDEKERKIDYLGAGLLTGGLSSLLLGLVWGGNQYAWESWQVISMLVLSPLLLAIFVWVEHSHAKDPILPLELFRNSIFRVSTIIMFLVGFAMFGAISYIPLFAQDVLGRTATNSGVILIPMVFTLTLVSLANGQLVTRTGRYKKVAILGTVFTSLGILWLSTMSVNSSSIDVILRMIVIGAGLGISMPIFNLVVQNAFEHAKLGVATSSVLLARSIGATVGVAVLGTILNNELTKRLSSSGVKVSANQLASLSGRNITPELKIALSSSITRLFLIGGLVVSLAFFASWFLKEIPLRTTHHDQPKAPEAATT